MDEEDLSELYSATAPWIRAQGLTYAIPHDLRTKLLDALNSFEIYNSRARKVSRCVNNPNCDSQQLEDLENLARERMQKLRASTELALAAIKDM